MEEATETKQKMPKRKARILQSTYARLRRKASKLALKKHKIKMKRENKARADGVEHRLPKQKRRSKQSE